MKILLGEKYLIKSEDYKDWILTAEEDEEDAGCYYLYFFNPKTKVVYDDFYTNWQSVEDACNEYELELIIQEQIKLEVDFYTHRLSLNVVIDNINNYEKDNHNLECEFEYLGLDKAVLSAAPFITLPAMGKIIITFNDVFFYKFNIFGDNGFFYTAKDKNFIQLITDENEIFTLTKGKLQNCEHLFKINLEDDEIVIGAEEVAYEITSPQEKKN